MNLWYTYILYSLSRDRYYIGHTDDIEDRLKRHNDGWGRFTKSGIPWNLVYFETFQTKSEAIKRELEIKRKKSRKYIERLTGHAGGRPRHLKPCNSMSYETFLY